MLGLSLLGRLCRMLLERDNIILISFGWKNINFCMGIEPLLLVVAGAARSNTRGSSF